MTTRIQKVLLTGKTHTTVARNGAAPNGEERLDIRLSTPNNPSLVHAFEAIQPHPTAEQLFAGAWSACYTSALEVIAKQMKVQLPDDRAVAVEVDLGMSGSAYLLQARFNVFLPGLDPALAEQIAHAADEICPYSKATRGNIDVTLSVHAS
ncbi:Ohr family peroxiredoxin [Achromobacter sp. Marseille-Q0513]|uniref:Ohr family peroxiredoxin n=1 Tax=Achromobacter sp. Marseille-Q0513 TaxID=2829161 RepID=UPI001B9D228F|nr:Ohr family peroxiredoxin [Achromobacter sp. Marseille-Q0513]MBR8652722.1 Ohr family peroxiredoxin [Achromobacter sp. Marseille-Q0513]